MKYEYKDPTTYGYVKSKLTKRDVLSAVPNMKRHVNILQRVDVYYNETTSTYKFEITDKTYATILMWLTFPLAVLVGGIGNIKDVWEDHVRHTFQKKNGAFTSYAVWEEPYVSKLKELERKK